MEATWGNIQKTVNQKLKTTEPEPGDSDGIPELLSSFCYPLWAAMQTRAMMNYFTRRPAAAV